MAVSGVVLGKGEIVGGYRVEEVIGIGGMSIVYRAEQLSLNRKVALKLLSSDLSEDPAFRERFRREGRHVAALEHPNVVTVYDFGEDAERLWMAMRLVEGSNLGQRMRRRPLGAEEAIALLAPIADALDAAHALHLVHRDVKPQNILLSTTDVPYLADFGVARALAATGGLTSTGAFVGSVHYAPPEQILGGLATPAGDVYALTAVLYQCLSGRVPYPRDTEAGVIHAHLEEPPPVLPGSSPGARELDRIIATGMAKSPSARYPQASELIGLAAAVIERMTIRDRAALQASAADEPPNESTIAPDAPVGAAAAPRSASDRPPADDGAQAGGPAGAANGDERDVAVGDGTEIVARPGSARLRTIESTAADRRREAPPAPAPAPDRRRLGTQRVRILAGVAALAILAAGFSAVVLASGSGHASPKLARTGPLELSYLPPWRPETGPVPASADLLAPILLRSRTATIAAGQAKNAAPIPGQLPATLVHDLGRPAATTTTRLLGAPVDLYTWTEGSRRVRVWMLPTAAADFSLVCASDPRTATGDADACTAVVNSARLIGVGLLSPGPDASLAASLRSALAPAATARRELQGLTARTLTSRSKPAAAVAAREAAAGTALKREVPPARYRAALASLVRAMHGEQLGFSALARAAQADDRGAYARAADSTDRDSHGLQVAAGVLDRAGITLPALKSLRVPALPLPQLPRPRVHAKPARTTTQTTSTPSIVTPAPTQTYTPPASPAVRPVPATSTPSKSTSTSAGTRSTPSAPPHPTSTSHPKSSGTKLVPATPLS